MNIYKIAELAQCSISTVSKAFNNAADISQQKKQQILEIARQHNYIPNINARALSTKNNHLIGIIYKEPQGLGIHHYFYSRIIESFRQAIESLGYDIVFINTTLTKNHRPLTYIEHCKYRNISGVLVVTFDQSDSQLFDLIHSSFPLVLSDTTMNNEKAIVSDDIAGAELATEYLVSKHHKKIYHIAGPIYNSNAAKNRHSGFINIIKKYNLEAHTKVYFAEEYSFMVGYNIMKQIIAEGNLPTAMFVGGDIIALGCMKAMTEVGIEVPKDISLVGFDDIELAQFAHPMLTTIRQDYLELGTKTAQILVDAIEHNTPIKAATVPVTLIERESVRAL